MTISNIISLLAGIALFLFGMSLMGDGLKKAAGEKLERLLNRLTNKTYKGVLLGCGATAVIQSSSAASIMAVNFVSAGMMRSKQAVGIILGAILGTSVTGWLLCLSRLEGGAGLVSLLSASTLTGLAAVAGILLRTLCRDRPGLRHLGDVLLGFAVLMTGMSLMSEAVAPLQESAAFLTLLTAFSDPLMGILAGAACAAVLQSASAAVGVLQALTLTGAIDFATALPLVMGFSIGAAVPVLASAVGANAEGKRAAFSYLAIAVLGVVLCGGAYYCLDGVFGFGLADLAMDAALTALLNTLFRLANVLLVYPMAGTIADVLHRLIPEARGGRAVLSIAQRREREDYAEKYAG